MPVLVETKALFGETKGLSSEKQKLFLLGNEGPIFFIFRNEFPSLDLRSLATEGTQELTII